VVFDLDIALSSMDIDDTLLVLCPEGELDHPFSPMKPRHIVHFDVAFGSTCELYGYQLEASF
jgi:hypothetical protein